MIVKILSADLKLWKFINLTWKIEGGSLIWLELPTIHVYFLISLLILCC